MDKSLYAAIRKIDIIRLLNGTTSNVLDDIAIEEPLEIQISFDNAMKREKKNISVTMRTPGNDEELAAGFLYTEGIISSRDIIQSIHHTERICSRNAENEIIVNLAPDFVPQLTKVDRNFYTTSSCGVCGKGSIESIRTVSAFQHQKREAWNMKTKILGQLPDRLRSAQDNFSTTGGIHASGIFDKNGQLLELREDVGRHNALDKLIGHALMNNLLPLQNTILLLSGRASFELIQKAAMAGIVVVAAIGAPSSLAVDLAREFDITLIGFLKDNRMNVYHQGNQHYLE
ncbi:formate dehydrogenase accessory sulfurtransferase FdhD [Sphingobacterium chungjuense]|uniref:formate dehydrogenase accessory sulfurtransferase FdhD n=1 Tax=Sphingobacterium chungjuense TaxID=2675553 RepID=UPI00140B9850|nr:formate dehydrogenase accessory sulfurtransferase FdhD [Sphingobacterium chungjuense]